MYRTQLVDAPKNRSKEATPQLPVRKCGYSRLKPYLLLLSIDFSDCGLSRRQRSENHSADSRRTAKNPPTVFSAHVPSSCHIDLIGHDIAKFFH
jgi:hypothetical protein